MFAGLSVGFWENLILKPALAMRMSIFAMRAELRTLLTLEVPFAQLVTEFGPLKEGAVLGNQDN